MADITQSMVERFLDDLFEKDNIQARTVKDIKVFLGNVMVQACKDGIISGNPVKDVVINRKPAAKYAKDKSTEDDFFSYEEAGRFLEKAEGHELFELFYLTLFFGLRMEEALGLRWSAIDFANRTMKINHTV